MVEEAVASWLSRLLVTCLPLETALRVWDSMWTQVWTAFARTKR